MRSVVLASMLLAACAGSAEGPADECSTTLSATPVDAIAGAQVRVTASVDVGGVATFSWRVTHDGLDVAFVKANSSGSEITFTAPEAGPYYVTVTPSVPGEYCGTEDSTINVREPMGNELNVRFRITPPPDLAVPPIDRPFIIPGGADFALGLVQLDAGRLTTGTVGMPAYVKFMPDGQPEAIVETYTSPTGAFTAQVQNAPHRILVVPTDPAFPPQIIADTPAANEVYTLDTGVAITGTVRRPNNTALAGASVQLFIADVPSTIATTAADGTFTLRASALAGDARVVVTPPAGSGLPRLEAESAQFTFSQPIAIAYGTTLTTRNVGGTVVQRAGAIANAKVTIVGTIPAATAGTVTAGASASALGYVRIAATANGSGALPSTLVPAADLYAVVTAAAGDYAVATFDTTTAVPATIVAPAMTPVSTTVQFGAANIGGARLELVPSGALELAGIGSTVVYASEAGVITSAVASGAKYVARFSDPSLTAGSLSVPSFDATSVTAATVLPRALTITGTLGIQSQTNRIVGAAIEVFCNHDACEGIERTRPMGEGASNAQGEFTLTVTDPGAM